MTWINWQVPPFVTSVFFVLGVLALYWLSINWITVLAHDWHVPFADEQIHRWYGVIYMLVFVFGIQTFVVGTNYSWQFMNFQIIGIIFCAYFLDIHVPYYFFVPIVLVYMLFNGSLTDWESWCHAVTLMLFFWSLNLFREHYQQHRIAPLIYMIIAVPFGGLLWFWMKLKFDFSWITFGQEWLYLVIFEVLLYVYVNLLTRESEFKQQLAQFASHDALTGTENYAAYSGSIQYLFNESRQHKLPLSMMMFDIDHFKHINDTYGHAAGDRVLQAVTETAQTVITANDTRVRLYRTGGEEFNVVLPGYDTETAEPMVRQIFDAVNHLQVTVETNQIELSISVGLCAMIVDDQTPIDFYQRVDQNLYYSKQHGRMQMTID
ncbi:GGDEF domain-containing protein [Lactiplantibacillus sp. WILCCON 0030]|uniref:GGDEF domain-containing protein n=1 Tax=Lactiplantibacillus brownii TaxID=3069269 RepID=A0ABU1ABR0_9LACO|nr:GGDEF domain-containing protein [Lactiplantibacillus brownii]MDQ7938351.1 GGDEF domain-containing protein [Lactiplantibacillus brownii]